MIGSDEDVARERWEKGAIVMRLSSSWVRFGTFEYLYHSKRHAELETLADYVLHQSYPELVGEDDRYYLFFKALVERTARLMAQWQSVGFNHGVMNTDNMSIAGLTIDYGPFAFMDGYDHYNICNHTDREGRYCFSNQPSVAQWNLRRLMVALSPLVNYKRMEKALEQFSSIFTATYFERMKKKIGLYLSQEHDLKLVQDLFAVMHQLSLDFTPFFRRLSRYDGDRTALRALCSDPALLHGWLDRYDARLQQEMLDPQQRHEKMLKTNPKYVLKNHLLQEAIDDAERGDFQRVATLMRLASAPFDEHPDFDVFADPTPHALHNRQLSCSS
jgi:uncharacterized protein YdiU (UPF0061 family)